MAEAPSHGKPPFSRDSRIITLILGLATLLPVVISPSVWLADRAIAPVPVIPGFHLPHVVCLLLLSVALVGAAGSVLRPGKVLFPLLALVSWSFLMLADWNRVHPWSWAYAWLWLALIFQSHRSDLRILKPALAIALTGIYFWGGIHKLNPNFFETVFPWLVEPFWESPILPTIAMVLAPLEAIGAILLLIRPFRRTGVALLLLMHLGILLCIGPLGHGWNPTVWPWNLAMMAWLTLLARDQETWITWPQFAAHKVLWLFVLPFGLYPASHLGTLGDAYLSFSLYSGKTPFVVVCEPGNQDCIYLEDWARETAGIAVHPNESNLRALAGQYLDQIDEQQRRSHLVVRYFEWGQGKWQEKILQVGAAP